METPRGSTLLLLLLLLPAGCVDAFKPVVIVHGLLYGSTEFIKLSQFINKVHPGTKVMAIDIYMDMASLTPMWKQVKAFRKVMSNVMLSNPDGIHLVCFSQGGLICRGVLSTMPDHNVHTFVSLSSPLAGMYGGGLICRGVLSTMPDHNVHTFVSLSSPLAGMYGVPDDLTQGFPNSLNRILHPFCLKKIGQKMAVCNYWKEPNKLKPFFPENMKDSMFRFCYNKVGQRVSLCNYWNDPKHRDKYLKSDTFLSRLNGEKPHRKMKAWKKNFLRIKKLVLIGGPDDGVITPWQSSCFGFYDQNRNIVEMRNQKFYQADSFGLKTLDERGDISVCVQPGVKHVTWHSNFTVYDTCMKEWLT